MELDLNFPILFKAVPPGKNAERHAFIRHVHRAEVAEISHTETEFVHRDTGVRGFPDIRVWQGRHYRRLAGATPASSARAYNWWEIKSTSPGRARDNNPAAVSAPVHRQVMWAVDVRGMNTARGNALWPDDFANTVARGDRQPRPKREKYLYEEHAHLLRDIDAHDLERGFARFQARAEQLLVLSGNLWAETRAPCLAVSVDPAERRVVISAGFVPDCVDLDVTVMRFPVSRIDEARRHARALSAQTGLPVSEEPDESRLPFLDPAFAEFDEMDEAVHRAGFAVASNLVRRSEQQLFHRHYKERSDPFETNVDLLARLRAAVYETDEVLGTRADFALLLPEAVELWRAVKRPTYGIVGGKLPAAGDERALFDPLVDHALHGGIDIHAVRDVTF
jgi:hypothetical protein